MLSFKRRKTLYVFFVSSIIVLLMASQFLVHLQLNKLKSDGELINDAGRMRMLSQRIVQQSFRSFYDGISDTGDLCKTVSIFENHIYRVNAGLDTDLYNKDKAVFDEANTMANQIAASGRLICDDSVANLEALNTLENVETKYIKAQNKFVENIQVHYESKLSRLSMIEIFLSLLTVLIILLEVWLIFIPMDKANSEKRKELKKVLKLQREISRTVAHDLRAPISSIASIHHMLENEIEFKNKDNRELFEAIGLAAENALATASSMLVIYQGDTIKHSEQKKINLSALAKAQARIISANDIYKNRIIVQRTCTNCNVFVNIHEISRMIINILDNALKYSDEGVFVEVHEDENGAFTLISIKDSGIGMSDELIDWITGKVDKNNHIHSEKGFGLGMQFIKRTVIKHRGFIKIKKLKKGTLFTVGLPLAKYCS
jgi:signal transduction histidine kinase